MLKLTCSLMAKSDAAERGEGSAERPHHVDDPVDVDARRGGEVGVVGDGPGGLAEPRVLQEQGDQHEHDDGHADDPEVLRRAAMGPMSTPSWIDVVVVGARPTRRTGTGRSCGPAATGRSTRSSWRSGSCPGAAAVARARGRAARRTGHRRRWPARVAGSRCMPQRTLKYQATMAPQVTISPWAKLVSPVVPKISDRPTAQMAMIRPNLMPSKMSCGTRSRSLSEARSRAPRSKISGRLWPGAR